MAGRSLFRRIERALLGFAFGIVAFVIERRILGAIKRGELKKAPERGLVATHQGEELVVSPKQIEQ